MQKIERILEGPGGRCGLAARVRHMRALLAERRIHRSTLLNVDAVKELHSWFGGQLRVRLKDGKTELRVARDRTVDVKARLGI